MARTFEIGGLKVTRHVDKSEINAFVAGLPPEKRADLKEMLLALHEKGLITIEEKLLH
ncbi:MAG TPA: hypothetical protein PLY40_02625 [Bacillota bacterium]|mgnify:CR=1 FL=1|nr:hypothetical protein [Bacillota bacterium]